MSGHYKSGGSWQQLLNGYGKAEGIWSRILDGYAKEGGVWKQVFSYPYLRPDSSITADTEMSIYNAE